MADQVKVDTIYYDMYSAAITGINNVITRLNLVTEESNTSEVLMWLEKLGKIAESLKSLEQIVFGEALTKQLDIRGSAKLNKFEVPNSDF
jgi:hypothetical protein